MRVFLSHKMSGVSAEEIYNLRAEYAKKLSDKFGDVEIIDNYNHHMSPDELMSEYGKFDKLFLPIQDYTINSYGFATPEFNNSNSTRLWHLGRSIQQLGQADAIYFIPGHCDSNGCRIEWAIAEIYGIELLHLDDDEEI